MFPLLIVSLHTLRWQAGAVEVLTVGIRGRLLVFLGVDGLSVGRVVRYAVGIERLSNGAGGRPAG